MATLVQIMQGIETRLLTIAGLHTNDISPGQITPPCAIVGVPAVPSYTQTLGPQGWEIFPTVTVLVSAAVTDAGQLALAAYADLSGTNSIPAAIAADKTLGSLVDYCLVESFRPLGNEEVGNVGYYGGVFTLRVVAST